MSRGGVELKGGRVGTVIVKGGENEGRRRDEDRKSGRQRRRLETQYGSDCDDEQGG